MMNLRQRALGLIGSGRDVGQALDEIEADLAAEFHRRYPDAPEGVAEQVARCGIAAMIRFMEQWSAAGHA